ncbi:FAD3 [Lepeophtheirus salmonis]|uniref:FAD3 n=1 Tax=Lepeophtheirus salmonis TaxID=72036 RepID=A0A7R8H7D8_LEPSM|nr:FAD3 [Lepeophtheirus salmonis]CAF2921467.1 FAD3 [Lepeophtheirus salmonis]
MSKITNIETSYSNHSTISNVYSVCSSSKQRHNSCDKNSTHPLTISIFRRTKSKIMILENVPTIVEIKKAIPKRDISYAFSSYMILLGLEGCIENSYVLIKAGVYIGYWILQGTIFAGIFCLGHDCGHGSFSNNGILNDTVGNILHTFILAPYYPWKLSHRVHHKNTNNIDKDEVFYPIRENQDNPRKKDSLLKNLPFFAFGFGWFGYVVKGYGPNGRNISHLNPINKHFKGIVGFDL